LTNRLPTRLGHPVRDCSLRPDPDDDFAPAAGEALQTTAWKFEAIAEVRYEPDISNTDEALREAGSQLDGWLGVFFSPSQGQIAYPGAKSLQRKFRRAVAHFSEISKHKRCSRGRIGMG